MIRFIQDKLPDGKKLNLRVDDFDIFDIDTAVFFARQLEYIKAQSYDVKYAELQYRRLFPVSNAAGPGATNITYRVYDQFGMSQLIGAYGKDLPRADIGGKEVSIPVRTYAISVGYNTDEIRKASRAGLPIDARKMAAAVRGTEQRHNLTAWNGDDDAGLLGIFNHPNLPIGNVINGAASTPEWTTKTPDEILFDMNDIVNDVFTTTLMVERADTLLLPPAQYAYIASTARSNVSDTTILAYFLKNNPFIREVIPVNELTGAGTGGADVMIAYKRSPDVIQFEIPMELLWHPEQRIGLEILVPAEHSIGGLNVYYPSAILIREDI
jgi:hypothetical protein